MQLAFLATVGAGAIVAAWQVVANGLVASSDAVLIGIGAAPVAAFALIAARQEARLS